MKFFKIFKKKPPPSPSSPNLICNIHWAEVQRELSQDIMKETLMVNSNTGNGVANNKNVVRLQNTIGGWNSAEEDNFSSEANSWSSISLSSSAKSNVQENLQEENFSRASSPGTAGVKSSMIDDISLEDVETFEERRLAKVRRKVSRVDSLKKFLFSSKLDEKKTKQTEQSSPLTYNRPVIASTVPGYRASCLEVHDRWLGVQQSVLREEPEEDEEDNLSCLVNINMDIGSGRAEARRVRESTMSPDSRYREELRSPDSLMTSLQSGPLDSSLLDTTLTVSDEESRYGDIVSRGFRPDIPGSGRQESVSRAAKNPFSFTKDPSIMLRSDIPVAGQSSSKVSRSYSQPSHSVRMKVLANNEQRLKQQYLKMIVFKPSSESLGVIITSSNSTNGFVIAHIDPGSVIDRDGRFRTGDRIVKINGHDLVELTISQVREILRLSGNQVEIEVIRRPGEDKKTGTKLNKSESLRIFRAVPNSHKHQDTSNSAMSNVVTERIITPQGNLTKTIITISDCTQPEPGDPRCRPPPQSLDNKASEHSQPHWSLVDIDIDPDDSLNIEDTEASDVSIHYVKIQVGPHLPGVGVILEAGAGDGLYVEDVLPGGQAEVAPHPGLLPGHHLTLDPD